MTLLELMVKIGADSSGLDQGIADAEKKTSSLGSKLKSGLGTAGKIIGGAVTAGAAAVGNLAKQAVSAYGEFQQLEGGIQTLFGKDAQTMMNNASKAFKTAGVSANKYMEMAIQSSAAMITSLEGDTERAASLMDQSIIDMSDNVNKMGTTMEAVQNAYRGFSRGNFTMLDNLALGYAGTKKGMQQLLADAEKIAKKNGQNVKYSIESYADMVEAIHVVQTEMGITGTTSKEAGDTITGSAGSAKAAWEDLKVAIASGNDEQLTKGIDNLIASVTVMGQNIIPIVERSLVGIGNLIEKVVPIISEKLPGLVQQILPGLLSAASSLVGGLVEALPTITSTLVDAIPKIVSTIGSAVWKILPELGKIGSDILKKIPAFLTKAVQTIRVKLPEFTKIAVEAMRNLASGLKENTKEVISTIITIVSELIYAFLEAAPDFIEVGLELIGEFIAGATEKIPDIIDMAGKLLTTFLQKIEENLPRILEKGVEILTNLIQGITSNIPKLVDTVVSLIRKFLEVIMNNLPQILQAGVQILTELVLGILGAIPDLIAAIPDIIDAFVSTIVSGDMIGQIFDAGLQMLLKLIEGFLDFGSNILDMVGKLLAAIGEAILGAAAALGEFGRAIVGFIFEAIKGAWGAVEQFFEDRLEAIFGSLDKAKKELAATQEEYQKFEGKKAQMNRYKEDYGSVYGYTGQESFAGSNSQADIYYRRQQQANAEATQKATQTMSGAPTFVVQTYIGGQKAGQTQANLEAMLAATGGGS